MHSPHKETINLTLDKPKIFYPTWEVAKTQKTIERPKE